MADKSEYLNLEKLIDIKLLEDLQDFFASTTNFACCTYYNENKVTKNSNFSDFCKLTRSTKLGLERCTNCRLKNRQEAIKTRKPLSYTCHAGLTDFIIPIIINNKLIADILGGQVLRQKNSEEFYRNLARELGIDEEKYVEATKKLVFVSDENLKSAMNLLHLVSSALSDFGKKNFELHKKNINESLYRKIMETIRSSLDIKETKQKIVDIIGKTLNADRCFIMGFNKEADNFNVVNFEYRSSDNILGFKGKDPNTEVPTFCKYLKKGKSLLINNKKIFIDTDDEVADFEKDREAMQRFNVISDYAVPLYDTKEFLGILTVHYTRPGKTIGEDEINLLNIIAAQTALAIHQAKLYDELKKAKAYQDAILNNMPSIAWLKDKEGTILAANQIFANTCGTTIENLLGKTDFDFYPKEYAEKYKTDDMKVIETKEPFSAEELVMNTKEGPIWHETFKSPVFDEQNNITGTVGIARNITERKEYELELIKKNEKIIKAAKRERLLREIITEMSSTLNPDEIRRTLVNKLGNALNSDLDIIYVLDHKTGLFLPVDEYSIHISSDEYFNPVGQNIIEDYDWHNYILQNTKQTIAYHNVEELIKDYKLSGTKPEAFIRRHNIKSMIAVPIIYAKKLLGFFVMNFIKAEKKATAEDLDLVKIVANQAAISLYQSQLYIKAQQASKAKSEFITNVSHELKTPLNVIIGFSEILATSDIESTQHKRYLENINNSGKHLLNLTNDIINISKIESGNFNFNYDEFNVDKLIVEVVNTLKLMINAKNIKITIQKSNAKINADKKIITQILYNLLNNAIKFTSPNGSIDIMAELDNDKLILAIKDSGIGIAKENQELIFEKFKQLDASIEKSQQGVGLGLAITKDLIESLHGSIHVESEIGKGSKFWFVLPQASKLEKEEIEENLCS